MSIVFNYIDHLHDIKYTLIVANIVKNVRYF